MSPRSDAIPSRNQRTGSPTPPGRRLENRLAASATRGSPSTGSGATRQTDVPEPKADAPIKRFQRPAKPTSVVPTRRPARRSWITRTRRRAPVADQTAEATKRPTMWPHIQWIGAAEQVLQPYRSADNRHRHEARRPRPNPRDVSGVQGSVAGGHNGRKRTGAEQRYRRAGRDSCSGATGMRSAVSTRITEAPAQAGPRPRALRRWPFIPRGPPTGASPLHRRDVKRLPDQRPETPQPVT